VSAHLERLAGRPRPVGSDANHEARRYCAGYLRSLGFEVAERPFEFSALPGRHGAQIIGAWAAAGFGLSLVYPASAVPAIVLVSMLLVVLWLGRKDATRGRLLRAPGVNLEATRGASPGVWLVAHIDSKSQPISSMVRTTAVVGLLVAFVGLFLAGGSQGFALCGVLSGVVLLFAGVGANSDGAADNASGVAAVLEAARLLPAGQPVGILITDAEELALAGAAEWAHGRTPAVAINCDTIDDPGSLVVFAYGARRRALDDAVAAATRDARPPARVRRPPPGVLTDSNAFARAGWTTVTLARGTIRTLHRIHTKRDSLVYLRGTGIPEAARVLVRLAEELA
jgi:hypothetical protein